VGPLSVIEPENVVELLSPTVKTEGQLALPLVTVPEPSSEAACLVLSVEVERRAGRDS
jgi:hypothetical protein